MFLIAGYQVICSGSIGAFQKHIVVAITRDLKAPNGGDGMAAVLDELQ